MYDTTARVYEGYDFATARVIKNLACQVCEAWCGGRSARDSRWK